MITKEAIEAAARAMCEAWHYSKIGTPDGDAEWRRKQDQYRTQARAALTAALAAMPGPAVKVKRLQWMTMDNGDAWSRPTFIGPIYNATAKGWMHRNGTLNEADGVEAAKAAAQADYEFRILSAITPAPDLASENERLRVALEAAKKVVDVAEHMTSCRSDDEFVWDAQKKINAALDRT